MHDTKNYKLITPNKAIITYFDFKKYNFMCMYLLLLLWVILNPIYVSRHFKMHVFYYFSKKIIKYIFRKNVLITSVIIKPLNLIISVQF